MKLSEAMRKGSKLMRQSYGEWGNGGDEGCALSMTALGSGTRLDFGVLPYNLMKEFPILGNAYKIECGCEFPPTNLWSNIIHLNDIHKWPADRIAGWIEAHVEVPTYSMLEIQEFIGEPIAEPVEVLRV